MNAKCSKDFANQSAALLSKKKKNLKKEADTLAVGVHSDGLSTWASTESPQIDFQMTVKHKETRGHSKISHIYNDVL